MDGGDETEHKKLNVGGMRHMGREGKRDAGGEELAVMEGACMVEVRN